MLGDKLRVDIAIDREFVNTSSFLPLYNRREKLHRAGGRRNDQTQTTNLIPSNGLRQVWLFEVLRVLLAKLEIRISHRLLDPFFTTQTNNRTATLIDAPRGGDTSHAHIVLLRHLLHPIHDHLIRLRLALPDQALQEIITLLSLRTPLTPRPGQHTPRDW